MATDFLQAAKTTQNSLLNSGAGTTGCPQATGWSPSASPRRAHSKRAHDLIARAKPLKNSHTQGKAVLALISPWLLIITPKARATKGTTDKADILENETCRASKDTIESAEAPRGGRTVWERARPRAQRTPRSAETGTL